MNDLCFAELLDRFKMCLEEDNEAAINDCAKDCYKMIPQLSLPEIDLFLKKILIEIDAKIDSEVVNETRHRVKDYLDKFAPAIRFFWAMYAHDPLNLERYIKGYHHIADRVNDTDVISYCNAFLAEFGFAAVPDMILLAKFNKNTKLYQIVEGQLGTLWSVNCWNFESPEMDTPVFMNLAMGYLRDAFDAIDGTHPKFLSESPNPHLDQVVEQDVKSMMESYEGEELEKHLEAYNARQLDAAGAYHIMANLMQEATFCMDSYVWVDPNLFESIDQRMDRENAYFSMCEAAYIATGKLPRYIQRTYDLEDKPGKPVKDPDWINPPKDDEPEPTPKPAMKRPPLVDDDDDDAPGPVRKGSKGGIVYNINYNNSFNKHRDQSVKDSYNGNRIGSHDISGRGGTPYYTDGDDETFTKEQVMVKWQKARERQQKIMKSHARHKAPTDTPPDVKLRYLKAIKWTDKYLRQNLPPWIIMLDTQDYKPAEYVGYRKYLINQMEQLAKKREIEYDGELVLGGDPADTLYDIELSRFNDWSVVNALRKVANAVIDNELKKIADRSTLKNKTVHEAVQLFDEMKEFEEKIAGGDPNRDRPFGQRVYNRIEDFNVKSQTALSNLDQGMRQTVGIANAAVRTPAQLIQVVKNFISDLKNRREQNLKELILKDKRTRLNIYGFMRSLIKTALPWVILGPLWGTLFNLVSLPIRAVKGAWTALRGGPHRDLMIEMRSEMQVELQIMDDKIRQASDAKNTDEMYKLARQRQRMEAEYLKMASKIHFDPERQSRITRTQIAANTGGA